jgi:hypothetical protein
MKKIQWQLISETRNKRNQKRKVKAVVVVDIANIKAVEKKIDLERISIDIVGMTIDTDQVVSARDRLRKDFIEMIGNHTKRKAAVEDIVQDLLLDATLDLPLAVVLDLLAVVLDLLAVIKFYLYLYTYI